MTHKPIRRLLALLIVCTMMFSLLAVSASAEDTTTGPEIKLVNTAEGTLKKGDTFTVEVRFPSNEEFSNFEFYFEFDLAVFKLKKVNTTYQAELADGTVMELPYISNLVVTPNLNAFIDGTTNKTYGGAIASATAESNTKASKGILFTMEFEALTCGADPVNISIYNQKFQKSTGLSTFEDIHPVITPAQITVPHTMTKTDAKEATCTEAGNSEYYVCSGCEKWFSDADGKNEIVDHGSVVIPATGHTAGETWQHDDRNHWHICETCKEPVDKTAHSGGTATCTAKPVCEVCKKAYGSTLAHNYVEKYNANQHWKECSVCGAIDPDHPKKAHTFGEWETVKDSTCTATGTKQRKCNDCAYVEQATIEMKAHTLVHHAAKAATCEAPGNYEYWACSVCGAKFSDAAGTKTTTDDEIVIPALDHKWGTPSYTWNGYASCTAERVCTRDGSHKETETAAATSSVTKEATCTETGVRTYTASFDNDAFTTQTKTEDIPALGHDWGEWAVENGVMTRHCSRCEATDTKTSVTVNFTAKDGPFTYDGQAHPLSYYVNAATVNGSTYTLGDQAATLDGTTVKDAQTYTVTATYEDETSYGTASVTFTIRPKTIDLSGWTWNYSTAFTYDGNQKTVALNAANEGLSLVNVTYANAAHTNAGTYTATATCTLKDTANYQLSGTIPSQPWTIEKETVTLPTAVGNLKYNGGKQTGVPGGNLYTVTGGTGTNAVSYTATVSLNDKVNYRWSDLTGTDESDDRTIPWSIAKADAMSLTGSKSLLYSSQETQTITAADVSSVAGVTLTNLTVSGDSSILASAELKDSTVTYTLGNLSKTDAGKTAVLTITFSSTNYEDSTYVLTIKVMDKADVSGSITFPDGSAVYTGVQQTYETAQYNGEAYANFTYSYSAAPINAGTYTVTATYEDETSYGTKTATFTINPAQLTVTGGTVTEKTYDGSTAATVTKVTFSGLVNSETLKASDYTVSNAAFGNANAGADKTVTFTVALADSVSNYTLGTTPNGSAQGTITPRSITVTVSDIPDQTYTGSAPKPAVTVSATGTVNGYELVKDVDYTVSYTSNTNAGTATATVTAKSGSNYTFAAVSKSFTIQKGVLAVSAENLTVTYTGTDLEASAIKGTASFNGKTVPGTWSWVTAPGVTVNGSPYTATVKFTPEDTVNFDAVVKEITVTITKADPTGKPAYTLITTSGKTLADANLGLGTLPEGGTVVWVDADGNVLPDDTTVEANKSYTWRYTPADTANYNEITGSVTLYTYYERPVTPSKPSTTTAPAETVSYTDVAKSDWFYDSVLYVSEKGLMTGTGANSFSPNVSTTRGMIVTILARLEGVDTNKGGTWYEAGQKWAMENGISDGTSMTGEMTREQLATILYRYAKNKGYDVSKSNSLGSFTDSGKVSDWAQEAMQWANAEGLINGKGAGLLDPQGKATRAETAAILMRFMKNVAKLDN